MIVLILFAVALSVIVLIQNPKGNNSKAILFVGAKNSEKLIQKSTWILGIGTFLIALGLA